VANLKCGGLVLNFIVGKVFAICSLMKSLNNIERDSSINMDSGFMREVRILIAMIKIKKQRRKI